MVGAIWCKDLMALVMEFCEKGTSVDVLKKDGASFTWDDPLLKWCTDTAKAMKYLHHVSYFDVRSSTKVKGIVHRDLKPENCLVTETYALKVADFGEARALDEENKMTQVGTPLYIAPEIVRGDMYDSSVDVYSYAMTILEFSLRGRKGFAHVLHDVMNAEKLKDNPRRVVLKNPSQVSIERCFGDEVFVVCVLSLLHSISSNTLASHSNIHTVKVELLNDKQGMAAARGLHARRTSQKTLRHAKRHSRPRPTLLEREPKGKANLR
jgi:serine/threonine protein kinase